jgi:hypothetical protein
MEHVKAAAGAIISAGSTVLAWISFQDARDVAGFAATIIACLSGLFAIRYYYFAGQEKKASLKAKKHK